MNRDETGPQLRLVSPEPPSADYDHIGRRLKTLQECALYKRTLRFTRPRCRHVRILDAVPLWWLFQRRGWEDAVSDVPRRLCCSGCKARSGTIVRPRLSVGRDPPTGEQLPYPDEATWRRLVSRFRS